MAENGPAVTVIIPTYNSSGPLRLALQSVLGQEFTDFEVWVVGDGCTDDSESVVASFADSRLHWFNLPSNSGGPSLPRNEGLSHARGRFIAYLGHDDLWFPWHLSELVSCINPSDNDFVYSIGLTLGPNGVIGTFTLPNQPSSPSANLSPSNWLHRKSLIEIVGSWADEKGVGDDREFLQRILSANTQMGFRKQLSVLKFPSVDWHMYSLKTDFPQTRYSDGIRQDAQGLRDELLLELANVISSKGSFAFDHRSQFYRGIRALVGRSMYLYGVNRWPMNRIFNRRWRHEAGLKGTAG
jgi:glycosyltransferase involved in cell wall biosynthesis